MKEGNDEPRGVLFGCVPSLKELLRDLHAAGIERRDSVGRVVHRPALRMTARTVAVRCGVSERVCDAVSGYTNANRMETRYTDISGLPLHEWTKLPWFGRAVEGNAQPDAQKAVAAQKINDLVAELFELVKTAKSSPVSEEKQGQKTDAEKWSGR